MFEAITNFISEHPYITTLVVLMMLAIMMALKSEDVLTAEEDEDPAMEDESGDEMIVCTVP